MQVAAVSRDVAFAMGEEQSHQPPPVWPTPTLTRITIATDKH